MPVVEGLTGKLSSKTQELEAPGISEGGAKLGLVNRLII